MPEPFEAGHCLVLLGTEGCHLCEQAEALLAVLHVVPEQIDIAGDDRLLSRYGVTIPVLKYGTEELMWPFKLEELQLWLENNGITYHT